MAANDSRALDVPVESGITSASVLEAAIAYRLLGWEPIPVPGGSKNPGFEEWQKTHLEDHELPQRFNEGSNIGLLVGEASGWLVDVDLDCPEAIALGSEILPATGLKSGRKGKPCSHYWYRLKSPGKTTQFSDPLRTRTDDSEDPKAMIIELRSTGAQTIVPPSRHSNGDRVVWIAAEEPAEVDYAELLDLASLIAATSLLARYWPNKGVRDKAAMATAGWLLRGGMSPENAERFFLRVTRIAGDEETASRVGTVRDTAAKLAEGIAVTGAPTLADLTDPKVVDKATEWLGFRAPVQPREWEPPAPLGEFERLPFPTGVLPDWMKSWVEAESTMTQTPTDLAGMLVIAVCAGTLAKKIEVRIRDGWKEPPNLWVVVIQEPGTRKSTVFSHAMAPVEEFESELATRMGPAVARAQNEYKITEQALKKAQEAAAKGNPDRTRKTEEAAALAEELASMRIPSVPRLVVDDCSPEQVAALLALHGGRIAVMAPEGDIFDVMAGRYAGNGTANFGVFLRGHAGDPIRVDRVGRGPDRVKSGLITMGLTVQPDVLRGLTETPRFRGRGLIGRFLFAFPSSLLGRRKTEPEPMPPEVAHEYRRGVRRLLEIEPAAIDEQSGEMTPHVLRFSTEARRALLAFADRLEPQLGETAGLGYIADWAGKLSGAIARLAGILHMAWHVEGDAGWEYEIEEATVGDAISIGQYLIQHARIAFAEMSTDREVSDAKHLLRWIESDGCQHFSRRDAFEATKGRFHKVANMDGAFRILIEHEYVREKAPQKPAGVGRKPSPVFEVNPYLFTKTVTKSHPGPEEQ